MFSFENRIDHAYRAAETVRLSEGSKIFVMSDVHRGGGNWDDDFAKNQLVYSAALKWYNRQKYTYIELGDGDELWKNKKIGDITAVHKDIFLLLEQFFTDGRLYMLYGNHDIKKKYRPGLMTRWDDTSRTAAPLFPGIRICESLYLTFGAPDAGLFLLHGHQADFFNDTLWRLARFLIRHIWKPLELIGFNDPTSASKNNRVKDKIEKRLQGWAEDNGTLLLAGHTHRAVFPQPPEGKYFNDGCCVHPWTITAIEVNGGSISLVKWGQKTHEDGTVYIGKDTVAGPYKVRDYFS
jgi:UDP-2,3-diacylglucosamine pyrophosphatase LpxH